MNFHVPCFKPPKEKVDQEKPEHPVGFLLGEGTVCCHRNVAGWDSRVCRPGKGDGNGGKKTPDFETLLEAKGS